MADPVVLLVRPRLLVLLDDVAVVLVDRGARDEPGLAVVAHPLRVHVQARLGILDEDAAADELGEVVPPLRVDRVGVLVRPLRQVDLGPGDAQEAVGVPAREGARLLRGDDVVRRRGHPRGERGRADGGRGTARA